MRESGQSEGGRRPHAWDIRRYESIDSTNLEARRLLDAGASPGLVVLARHQTGGRGRMGRTWLDLPGKSLMVSLVLGGAGGPEPSVLVALSARAAIVAAGGEGPRFKWPNDLVYGRRKVGGILSESYHARGAPPGSLQAGGAVAVIVGLGLNVGYLPGELDLASKLAPTSLLIEEGKIWDPEELLSGTLRQLEAHWGRSRGEWMVEYRANLAYLGETVRVDPPYAVVGETGLGGAGVEGVMLGVDDAGNAMLEVGGRTVVLASGDLHVPQAR
jgi:BirA family transcriptional regulator, biotin operon repressor / biotin---[acetyl-CoA-carboxylase] ligase